MGNQSILSITRFALLVSIALAGGGTACRKAPAELAPVKVGDFWEYKFATGGGPSESTYTAKFLVKPGPDDKSFILDSVPNANTDAAEVDLALDANKPIKQHFIGQIWLPPAARQINAKTRVGDVKEQRPRWNRWPVFVVEGYGAAKGQYFFDANTGFLVGSNIPTGGGTQSAMLLSSSIAGL